MTFKICIGMMSTLCIMTIFDSICIPAVIGVVTTLIGWIITTILLVPKLKIGDIERDSNGNPYVKILNKSSFLNAYKVSIVIEYMKITHDNELTIFHTSIRKRSVILQKGCQRFGLNINNQDEIEEGVKLNICVIGHNKCGVTTTINEKRDLKKVVVSE